MTDKESAAQRKLSLLKLAEELKNVSEACKIIGYSRQQYYNIKRSFEKHGFEGLYDKPPIPNNIPTKTPPEIEDKVIVISINNPAWGEQKIAQELIYHGNKLAPTTIRNIWVRNNIETRTKRLLASNKNSFGKIFEISDQ